MVLKGTNLFFLAALLLPVAARAAGAEDPDWPCAQALVPRISAAQVWAGPSPDPATWSNDVEVSRLASQLAARRISLDDTEKLIETFADAQPKGAVNGKLTALFGRTLQIINKDRASIIAGIQRFARHQRALVDRINDTRTKLLVPDITASDKADFNELLTWDLRIYEERQKSMTYLCEQPVLLEQRAFALGRSIYFYMED